MTLTGKEIEIQLIKYGDQLLAPSLTVSELLASLDRVESLLTRVEQSPSESMKKALSPLMIALVANELLRHSDNDVKVAVASCINEIMRITAPDAPYEDDQMKEVFQLIVSSFEKLDEKSSLSYLKRTSILDTVAKVRSCVVMLDLECDALILDMFKNFFRTIRSDHPETIFNSMATIMTLVLNESEEISVDLLSSILAVLKIENKDVLPIARQLGENVIKQCASKLKPYLAPALKSLGTTIDDYTKAVSEVLQVESEANDSQHAMAASKNAVGLHVMDDKPRSVDVVATTVGSSKSVVSNDKLQKVTKEDTSAGNDDSKEESHEALLEKSEPEPSKANVQNSEAEKLIKSRMKPDKAGRRKGKKKKSSKSSSEPSETSIVNAKEGVEMPEIQEKDVKNVDNEQSEVPVTDAAEPVENKKDLEDPVPSPKKYDEPVNVPSLFPGGEPNDETCLKKAEPEKKDKSGEDVPVGNAYLKKEPHSKKSSEGASVSESKSKRTGKKVPSAADKEDGILNVAHVSKKEDQKISELNAKSAKKLGKKTEVGNQHEEQKNQGQVKVTHAKNLTNSSSKDEGKLLLKSVGSMKSAAKSAKDEGDIDEASKSSSKRKRSSQKKGPKYGEEMVGIRVMIWWPDDKKFYEGSIEHFDHSTGKHKVVYTDGDVEFLKLERQKWKQILEDPVPDEKLSSDGESPDEATEMPKSKKAKMSPALAKQGKSESSAKKAGASTSKSKAPSKSQSKQKDNSESDNAKDKTLKSIGKSEENKSGKSSTKTSNSTPKSSAKFKDNDDMETSKGGSKSKQETLKDASKSKGKSTTKSGGKPNDNSKLKTGSTAEKKETGDIESSPKRAKPSENSKVKSPSKSQKSSNKRKRSTKG
ncbi:sister chromatid cohesion protein PDS5 homolog C-like isoform X2 [Amaranthus tricolor]|uniref:sister chromatid cohesion protein PDS5 homolog C-like isoform X2 n=1 Tax=Amaranthus tricolor TaxID=29722 RepID=UPI00258B672B|nr:sister chromatid cohesion protein PDS5 homolog C-like isoform X2 [Amaranthus tricolor]